MGQARQTLSSLKVVTSALPLLRAERVPANSWERSRVFRAFIVTILSRTHYGIYQARGNRKEQSLKTTEEILHLRD
jgi:hypothetical protein